MVGEPVPGVPEPGLGRRAAEVPAAGRRAVAERAALAHTPLMARVCTSPGCPKLTPCAVHAAPAWKHASTADRGYGWQWARLRASVLREEPCCAHCGRAATTVDHVRPKARGGTDERENLQALCAACHTRKTDWEKNAGRVHANP